MDSILRRGIELYNAGEFFEAHEVLEEAWTPERGPRRLFLQSLIHVAVGAYHRSRGNPVGACRQLRKALRKMEAYLPECEGVDTARLYRDTRRLLEGIEADPVSAGRFEERGDGAGGVLDHAVASHRAHTANGDPHLPAEGFAAADAFIQIVHRDVD